jgi:putative Mg2+ transporter-C (MgtC) family protein
MSTVDQLWMLIDVLVAAIFAGIVGIERQKAKKPAGLRTHMIVGSVSCLLVSLGSTMGTIFYNFPYHEALRIDPLRIIQAIILGVSFIGAGTILKSAKDEKVRYLTTSATILFSAGIGISVALQQYVLAFGVSLMALLINNIFRYIDEKLVDKK